MYTAFFALSDLPFSIAPDPDYLFMSDRHREALAHLTYGLGTTGGFVLLTGEVGTGKTTISRRLMAQLPDNTQTAFILNPTLSSQELLATICDELKIRYRKTGATLKTLTDKIQGKLLKNHQDNIDTLLIIDEAQHLQPEVLEQLRLLTNLETNTKKLLQVILIGQPELQQLLQRRDLRQLAQRITARYHLMPLNKTEVALYIQHRLSVADCYRVIFDKNAVAMIHQLSQGIPRLINLLCDRSLWLAYGDSQSVVNKKTVIKASAEALGEEYKVISWWLMPVKIAASLILTVSLVGVGIWWGQNNNFSFNNTAKKNISLVKTTIPIGTVSENSSENSRIEKINAENKLINNAVEPLLITKNEQIKTAQNKTIVDIKKIQVAAQQPIILGYKSNEYKAAHQQAKVSKKPLNKQYHFKATQGVSDKLLKNFQNAVSETIETSPLSLTSPKKSANNDILSPVKLDVIRPLAQMPQWLQQDLPSLKFEMHIYASDGEGWVRVNGVDVHEGEKIAKNLVLEKIEPQQVILNFRGEEFSMPALSSW
ncbi:MAG: AAA family ATPase [Alteromonadaceae bacterium]|nr:AAA family ATPase [Alteromonadaceae bacterium]